MGGMEGEREGWRRERCGEERKNIKPGDISGKNLEVHGQIYCMTKF